MCIENGIQFNWFNFVRTETIAMYTNDILVNLRKILRGINLESKRIHKEVGLSIPQLLTLSYLRASDGFQSTQKEIKAHLSLNSSTVTGIISRLEKKGLIAKLPKSGDKRVTRVVLTSQGSDLIAEAPVPLQHQLELKLAGAKKDEVAQLKTSLSYLVKLMGVSEIEASPILSDEA